MISVTQAKDLLLTSWKEFNQDEAPRLGAALAYYTILSLAPLLILLIAIAGMVFGKEAAQGQLSGQIHSMVGPDGAKAIEGMIAGASKPSSGVIASVIGLLTLLYGASSVAGELKASLNTVWNRPTQGSGGLTTMIKERSKALGVVLAGGFLLLVSLVMSSVVAAAGTFASSLLPLPAAVLELLNSLVSIVVIAGVFAVLFKFLPDVEITWRDVAIGAFFTAVLFTAGKFLIGMYLGKASFGSTYGAAASLVIVLVWVYYSSQIFLFGAEFTQAYARELGSDPLQRRSPRREPSGGREPSPAPEGDAPTTSAPTTPTGTGAVAVGSLLGGTFLLTKFVNRLRARAYRR